MRTFTRTTSIILTALFSAAVAFAKEWRGIVPLHSTRDDVKRLLGIPHKSSTYAFYYRFSDEMAVIHFQTTSCKDECGLGWNVPVGTVISIGVIPTAKYRRDKIDLKDHFKLEKTDGGFMYYTNEEDGVSVEEYSGTVTLINYAPAEKEAPRRCPRISECTVDFFPKLDEYGNLPFEDEKARLDNFVTQMKELMGRGAIVVYGENAAVRHRLTQRAQRSKKYLIQKRGLESQRLLIVSGGYKDRSITELHLYTIGGEVSRIYLFPQKDPR